MARALPSTFSSPSPSGPLLALFCRLLRSRNRFFLVDRRHRDPELSMIKMANLPQNASTAQQGIFRPPNTRRALDKAPVPLFRNGNPWRDVRHVMTPLAERVARMQPAHFSGPFRLLELPPEMVVEIARHLLPTALFGPLLRPARLVVRPSSLIQRFAWDLTRLRERDYDFADNQDVPCGYCLDIHSVVERPFRCPAWYDDDTRDPNQRSGGPQSPPSMVRYLAKLFLYFSNKHDDPSGIASKLEKGSYILTQSLTGLNLLHDVNAMEARSKLRFIGDRLFMRSKVLIAKIPSPSTRNEDPNRAPEKPRDFTKLDTWSNVPYWRVMSQPCVCHHFTEKLHNLHRSEPLTRPPPVPTPDLESSLSLSGTTTPLGPQPQEGTGTSGTSAHDQHPELGESDGSVFSCDRCCTDWSITFKNIPQEDGRHSRAMMIMTWKLLGGFNKARRDDWAWETHVDPMTRWRVFREQPGEFCKAWEGDACVQRENGDVKYHSTMRQGFVKRFSESRRELDEEHMQKLSGTR
ncbi:hypothetical protein V8F33_011317 [Rhypophila sp. PSN 637]